MSTTVNQNPSAHSRSPSSFILQLLAPLLSLTNSQKSLARRSGVQDDIDHAEPLYSEEDPQIRKRVRSRTTLLFMTQYHKLTTVFGCKRDLS